jgi:uncharacterized protein YcbK (DUF882 family)
MISNLRMSRRRFLKLGLFSAGICIWPPPLRANTWDLLVPARALSFRNLHTEESVETVYWSQGRYLPGGLEAIDYILRDHRTGESHSTDTELLDVLYAIRTTLAARQPFHIISGYRSPRTNAFLCESGRGVARNSLHVQGKAADIRIPGIDLSLVRDVARSLKQGGVGYYPSSNFVHVDVGRVRYW